MLFQTSSRDPVVYGCVALLIAVISLAATALPGLRAAQVNPGISLRGD
jgi:ABC-type lipoprotein release transport system permease subunit